MALRLSRSARAGLVSFERARVFALDEFGELAADDPGRTRHTLQHQLLDASGLPPSAFRFLDPDVTDTRQPPRRVDLHDTTVQSSARYFAHQNLPRWGLTVGLKALLASKEVWLLANGPAKAGIIRTTVRGEIDPSNPASLLRTHPNCSLFVDLDAGGRLLT